MWDNKRDFMDGLMMLYIQGGMGRTGGRMGMKKVPCCSSACSGRRVHHERPDTPRGTQFCTVKANHTGPAYCSLNCYIYGKGELKEKEDGNL
jgi:hypothetical protein